MEIIHSQAPATRRRYSPRAYRTIATVLFVVVFSAIGTYNLLTALQSRAQATPTPEGVTIANVTEAPTAQPLSQTSSTPPASAAPAPAPVQSTPAPQPTTPAPTTPSTPVAPAVAPTPQPTPKPAYNKVSIPSLGFSSRFVTVGLTADRDIDVHPTLVGRWDGSAQPGTPGAVFLDGHNPGVFSALPGIGISDTITIDTANGTSYHYKVVYREIVALKDVNMKKALKPYNGATEGLNLMTCIGAYDPALGTSPERLIVYAVRA